MSGNEYEKVKEFVEQVLSTKEPLFGGPVEGVKRGWVFNP